MDVLRENEKIVEAVFDGNACKLLAVAQAKTHPFLPFTTAFVFLKILLDLIHRNSHD